MKINPFIHLDEIHVQERPDLELRPVVFEQVKRDRYLISNYGDIYSLYNSKFCKPQYDKDGYNKIELATNAGHKKIFAHRLVAYTYVPNPDPEHLDIVNHIDGNKKNNYYKNLEHCTDAYNRQHAVQHGLMRHGEDNPRSKFTEAEVREICKRLEEGQSPVDIKYNYHPKGHDQLAVYDVARRIAEGSLWRHVSKDYDFQRKGSTTSRKT